MRKLEEHFNTKAEKGTSLLFNFKRRFAPDGSDDAELPPSLDSAPAATSTSSLKEEPQQLVKINVKEGKARKDRYEWVEVLCDKVCDVRQVVHININWMVCSGTSIGEYVIALRRRTQQLGLKVGQLQCTSDCACLGHCHTASTPCLMWNAKRALLLCACHVSQFYPLHIALLALSLRHACTITQLVQLPQYAAGHMINVHPFVTHAYIPVASAAVQRAMEHVLCGPKLDFVRDNDLRTDWKVSRS
jgi:hypothetical protein